MISMLQGWKGSVEINGTRYDNMQAANSAFNGISGSVHIKLYPVRKPTARIEDQPESRQYKVTVKKYMTQKSSPQFDFMEKWNHNVPMPLRTMIGTIQKETRGMVYMKLHGDIYADRICTCMKCGRVLTNPVSQYFGIGPECGNHGYVNPFNSDAELKAAVDSYRKQLQSTTWEGWIIKSAITEQEEMKDE